MADYANTRSQLEDYFDQKASETWERLTSDAPVSRVRETVRKGRDQMRAIMLDQLPDDLSGRSVLDAGCGAGQAAIELAARGADVVAVDVSPRLLEVAEGRTPEHLKSRITYVAGDMADASFGVFDHVFAMDSLIHYRAVHIAGVLAAWRPRVGGDIAFTIAPKTPFLTTFWLAGKLFPRSDRSPKIIPHSPNGLKRAMNGRKALAESELSVVERVSSGFYISQAMELTG